MNKELLVSEVQFKAVRSSGAGGQNVNKVSSKVILSFDLNATKAFSEDEIASLRLNLKNRLTKDHVLILNCDEDRSQLKNKELVVKRFLSLIQGALQERKPRKTTKVPRSVIEKRLKAKRSQSEIKQSRKKPKF